MKIEDRRTDGLGAASAGGLQPTDKDRRAEAGSSAEAGGSDRAAFSERGRQLSRARAAFEASAEAPSARFAEVQQALASGAYRVPHASLARRMASLLTTLARTLAPEDASDGT